MKKITLESEDSAEAVLKVERNRKIQNVIIFLTILQGVFVVFFGLNERNQFYLHQTAANIFILAAIILKILIDPIVIWISFQVVNFLIDRIILTVQDQQKRLSRKRKLKGFYFTLIIFYGLLNMLQISWRILRYIYSSKESFVEQFLIALFYMYRPVVECALCLAFVAFFAFQCKFQK